MKARNTTRISLIALVLALLHTPLLAQSSVAAVNAASFEPQFPVSPGCWASAFADFGAVGVSDTFADTVPFPTMLGGVQVFVNDVEAPMNFVGAGQINSLYATFGEQGHLQISVISSAGEGHLELGDRSGQRWVVLPASREKLVELFGEPKRESERSNEIMFG